MAEKIIPVQHKYSSTSGVVPTADDLLVAQIAVNLADKKLFSKTEDDKIISLGGGSGNGLIYGEVDVVELAEDEPSPTEMTATIEDIEELAGNISLALKVPYENAEACTLNINELGAKPVYYCGSPIESGVWCADALVILVYNEELVEGGCWQLTYCYDYPEWQKINDFLQDLLGKGSPLTGSYYIYTEGLDLNECTEYAHYHVPEGTTNAPTSDSAYFVAVDINDQGNATVRQTAVTVSLSDTYVRWYEYDEDTETSSWTEWTALADNKINKAGDRGTIAGYEWVGTSATINQDSPDSNECSENITVENGVTGTCWTKVVRIAEDELTVELADGWVWQGGLEPTLSKAGLLVLCWCGSGGMAQFVSANS